MIAKIPKETCQPCKKFINIGQPILECEKCSTAIHTKCYKSSGYANKSNQWLCNNCLSSILPRYNPFAYISSGLHSDKFHENNYEGIDEILQSATSILETCNPYSTDKLLEMTEHLKNIQNPPLSTMFLNIDGNTSNFNTLLVELMRIKHSFPVIGLAETNVDEPLKELYAIPEYSSFYQNTLKGKSKGTGVALYVRNDLNAAPVDKVGLCTPDIESIFVEISNIDNPLTVGVIYRPPSGEIDKFLESMRSIVLNLPKKNVHILGDFNIDLLKESSKNTELFEDFFLQCGYAPVISIPTHERPNCRSTCIDNVLTNSCESVMLSGTLPDNKIGDHTPIFEVLKTELPDSVKQEKTFKIYEFSNANMSKFVEQLSSSIVDLIPSVDFSDFTELFCKTLDETCKLAKPKETKRTPLNNPWITDGIAAAVDKKHALRKDWTDSITDENPDGDNVLHQNFRKYRKLLQHIINSAKNTYKCNKILENKENSKKTWQLINELRGKSKKVIKPPFLINNERIFERRVIANEFNKYFNSIASNLNDAIDEQKLADLAFSSFEDYLFPNNPQSMYLEDCDSEEILEIIKGLENNKSSDIPIRLIKKSAHIFSNTLANYFNIFMKSGLFPDVLKLGKVTPVFKKGNPEVLGNYRPVSTLPIFGKIFEKIIYSRVYKYAISCNLLNENQFGFRQSHSTCHAVNYSVSLIQEALHKNRHVIGIFIDLSKAFDTIDHKILLKKLDRYGIRGVTNSLIRSYLSRRVQYTDVLGEKSDVLTTQYGVPQGSVLGPLLFLLYINDISRLSKLGVYVLFADDTNIFVEGVSAQEAYEKGNELLKCLYRYMILNKLHVNMSKCCFMHFRPHSASSETHDQQDLKLEIDGFVIKQCSQTRFLGVIIDERLNWDAHIKYLKRKLNYAMSTLYRIMDSIPKEIHRDLYYTLFESHLSYCISVWGGATQYRISSLWTIQKQCVRVLFGDREAFHDKFNTCARTRPYDQQVLGNKFYMPEHTKPLFATYKILSVHNLYTYHCFMETYKILKFRTPWSLYEKYNISERKPTLLIAGFPSPNFTDRTTFLWNLTAPKLKFDDFSPKVSGIKNCIKRALLINQHKDLPLEWTPRDWDASKISIN
jgi:hypothetical protein